MSHPGSHSAAVTAAFLDRILSLLAPLFLNATGGDLDAARDTVRVTLASYNARTDEELRLAALTVAFGFGALDALSKAADPDLSLNQVLRLRGNACSLSQAGNKAQARLEKMHKQSAEPAPEPEPEAAELPDSADVQDLVAFARTAPRQNTSTATPGSAAPLTRQQRRANERAAEKAKRQQDYQARRAALLTPHATKQ